MAPDSKLFSVEDSLKEKYSEIDSRISNVELKQFKKHEDKNLRFG